MRRTQIAALPALAALALALTGGASRRAEEPLRYTTGWLGNSLPGGPTWVQNFNEQMSVLPDGTVYLPSFWDEAGREVGIYRDGRVVGAMEHTHMRGGFGLAVGGGYAYYAHTVAREDAPEVKAGEAPREKPTCYFGVSRYTLDGKVAPFPGGKTPLKNMLSFREAPDNHELVPRAAVTDGRTLYVADTAADRVVVIDCATMRQTSQIALPSPNRLALAPDGTLWALSGGGYGAETFDYRAAGPKVLRIAGGKPEPVALPLPPDVKVMSLAFVGKSQLLVTDRGPRQQVYLIEIGPHPRLLETIGERRGLYAGPTPGRVGPLRFAGLTGAAMDARGRLYVSQSVPRGGTVLRSFERKDGSWRLLWELYSLEFVDVADADPASDGALAYTADGKYERGPSGWRWTAQTLDPYRYPHDLRQHVAGLQCATQVRRLEGKAFLSLRGMWQGILGVYRIQGEQAIPAVVLTSEPIKGERGGFRPPGQPAKGRYLWRDANGNGQMEPGEYTPTDGPTGEYWASNMDSRGDLWQGGRTEGIWRWRFEGLDARGVPRYRTKPDHEPMPAPITDLLRTEYIPESDTMYLTGQTREHPIAGGEWGTAGTVVCRYDHWSKPTRALRYTVDVPYEAGKTFMVSFAVAGDLFLGVDCKSATVWVYNNRTGRYLGALKPGPEVHGESGWVDFRDGLRAFRRRSGDYLIFVEDDWKGKSLVYDLLDPLKAR